MDESFVEYLKPQAPATTKFLERTLFLNSTNKMARNKFQGRNEVALLGGVELIKLYKRSSLDALEIWSP